MISVSADEDKDKWSDFIQKKQMDWPQYFDQDRHMRDLFNIHAFPTYLVLNGEGIIVDKLEGLDERQSVAARLKDTLKKMKELQ